MFKKRAQKKVLYFTKQEVDNVSNWIEELFANQKSYISFFTGTVLMIGLFGTFTGLLKSIDEMGAIILGLSGDINLAEVIASFSEPLGGMAIGFASSLFGVAAAIILSIKGYILSRNEAIFLEDVYDWMNGQIVESQVSDDEASQGMVPQSSGMSGGMMDMFVDQIGDLSSQMEKYNKSNEAMFGMLSDSIDGGNETTQRQMAVLENISSGLKELNINQFSSTNIMEESLQEVSGAIMNQNKTMKKMLEIQQQNNEMLSLLINNIEANKEFQNKESK
jgi:hypothetical protein